VELVVLGSGTCVPTLDRSCACYFLKIGTSRILVDIGFGALRRLAEARIDYKDVDYVVITHTHLDHVGDLAPLLMALKYTPDFNRTKPLVILGPAGFCAFFDQLAGLFGSKFMHPDNYTVDVRQIDNETLCFDGWEITGMRMKHNRPSNGYIFRGDDRILSYSGDTEMCEQAVTLAQGADLAIFECSYPDHSPVPGHLTPSQVGEIAARAGCKKILLSHLYPLMENVDIAKACGSFFGGEMEIAGDLTAYIIE